MIIILSLVFQVNHVPKVDSAKKNLTEINPDIKINTIQHTLDKTQLEQQVELADVVLDATDNFETRFAINKACMDKKKPLVSGAAIRFEGQLSVFNPRIDNCPCYSCLYPDTNESEETCSENGILSPVVGVIGSLQALEAIKIICGIGEPLHGKLLLFDALLQQWRTMSFKKDPNCPVCRNTGKTSMAG